MPSFFKHDTSIVHESAQVGAGTRIWQFCHIMQDSILGERCVLGQNVMVAPRVQLGNGVKVQNNVSIYTGVICEDDVFLGPSMVFTNVINPRAFIERKEEFKQTFVKKGATIGANATILCGITIGQYAMIGAGAVVTKDVPDFALVYGNPAKQEGWVSRAGRKLVFTHDVAKCPETGENYELRIGELRITN